MRKITAICLLCTLILSQYGRFLAYVQCTISGLVSPGTTCDCEKQNPPDVRTGARDLPPPKGMNVTFEEYYLPVTPWALQTPPAMPKNNPGRPCSDHSINNPADIFRPPRA